MQCWGLGLVLVFVYPLMVWQSMAKGFFFSFYVLNNLLIQVIPSYLLIHINGTLSTGCTCLVIHAP